MQGLFRSRRILEASNIQYVIDPPKPRENAIVSLSKNSAEPRDQGFGERRIEVAFGPERCACAARFEQRLRAHAARYGPILGREAVRLLVRARQLTMNLLDAHATWP